MRKRSKYRPKKVLVNPLGYVIEGLAPIAQHGDHLLKLKLQHHMAMANLTQGKATRYDMDVLINMGNMSEALYRMGFGTEYASVIASGMPSLLAVCRRGAETNRFILRSEEMRALNELIELHDAQMEVVTVNDVDKAVLIIERERRDKRTELVIDKKEKK
jgi:hypothetical protein